MHGFTKGSSASLSDSKLQQASTLIILFTQGKMSVWKKNVILSAVITWDKVPVGIQKEKTLRNHLIPALRGCCWTVISDFINYVQVHSDILH